jgi:hypothetical protein
MRSFQINILLGTLALAASAKQISRLFDQSVWSEVEASPFHVELVASQNSTNVQAIITNRASTPVYYPLSTEELVSKLQLYTEDDIPVEMAAGTHTHSHAAHPPTEYQRLEVESSVTRNFDLAVHYELSPSVQYYVQVGGLIPFYREGQASEAAQSQSHMFEAAVLPFEAPSTLPVRVSRVNQGFQSPNIVVATCSDKEMNEKMVKAVPHALLQIKKSIEYVKTGKDRTIMNNFFKSDSEQTKGTVLARFEAMAKALESTTGPGRLQCAESSSSGKGERVFSLINSIKYPVLTSP